MVAVTWPVISAPGRRPHESGGRLINAYAEPLAQGAPSKYGWRRSPGLRQFASTANTGNRGQLLVGSNLFAAWSGTVKRYNSAGVETAVGAFPGTKGVFWAANNKSPTADIVVVDPDNGAKVVTTGSVSDYPDPDLPQPNSVTFGDGFFFFTTGDGRCFASALNDTAIDALDEVGAQAKRDGLVRGVFFNDLYLCGQNSIEVYHDTAEATGFPFSRAYVIQKGILSPYGITGFEDGFGKGIIFLGDDASHYAINGFTPTKISTPDVDRAVRDFIEAGGDPNTIEMFSYVAEGRSCFATRCSAFTWVYDLDSLMWHERKSINPADGTYRDYWRATHSTMAFGKWICGDVESGKLAEITKAVANELGSPLVFHMESAPATGFPSEVAVPQATFNIARGVGVATGTPNQVDPQCEISWSDDGGYNFSTPLFRRLGKQSEVLRRPVRVNKTGKTKTEGRRWRLRVSDEVDVIFTGSDMQAEARQA
ncbi:MAG TPA: hypothetical protein VFB29_00420 [Pseudolabrys sp.]|nr:hypothetical protein [Pseudolabrys sp.]